MQSGQQDGPEELAAAEARRTGKPVEVEALRTESSDTVAQPGGHLVTKVYVQPQRTRKNGKWVDLDPTLQVQPDGRVAPKASTADVSFSGGGGEQPLIRIARAGRELKLSWPKPVPKPVLDGETAEYRGLLPDVDLRLTATPTGFSQVLVVHNAAAAKNPELDQLRLGLSSDGLIVKQDAEGNITAVDKGAGGVVFEAGRPSMWDSSSAATAPAPAATAKAGRSAALMAPGTETGTPSGSADPEQDLREAPADGAKVSPVAVALPAAQDHLVLTPDQKMLDDPATVFPVMIDPNLHTPGASHWASVSRTYPNEKYWHYSNSGAYVDDAGVGFCADKAKCAPNDVKRSFFEIPTDRFIGKQIIRAQFNVWQNHSYSCTKTPIELWNTAGINSQLNWNAQNNASFWARYLDKRDTNMGGSGCDPRGWLEFGSDGVRNLVQDAANSGWQNTTFGIKAANEGDANGWKRFGSAYLHVEYNLPPRQTGTDQLSMSPGGGCSSNGIVVNNWPQLTALGHDPDDDRIGVQFAIGWDDGSGYARRWYSTGYDWGPINDYKGSGSPFSVTVPNWLGAPANNGYYGWEMRAWDGYAWGPWSSDGAPTPCFFRVDTSAPAGPVVTSPSHPVSSNAAVSLPWVDGVGKYAPFVVDSASNDVVRYEYQLMGAMGSPATIWTNNGAPQTIQLLPEREGMHTLVVQAFDAAGNASQRESYYFNIATGTGPRSTWAMDEPNATTTAATGGTFTAKLGPGASLNQPGHKGQGLSFNGSAQDAYARTDQSVLNTSDSFTVTAWVKPTVNDVNRVAVSQAGKNQARFALGLIGQKWGAWAMTTDTTSGFDFDLAQSTASVTTGQWTHLAAVFNRSTNTLTLYVNGLKSSSVPARGFWPALSPLEIGRSFYTGNPVDGWNGGVDEVKLWDRSLNDNEVGYVANSSMPTYTLAAKAIWELDETTGGEVTGRSETSSITLLNGATTSATHGYGRAATFDGTTQYGKTTRQQVAGYRSFSVSAWARLPKPADGDNAARVVAAQIGTYNAEFSLYYSAYLKRWIFGRYKEDTLQDTLVRSGSECTVASAACETEGQWTHLLGVSDATAGKIRLYVNGTLAGEADYWQNSGWSNAGVMQIGASSRNGALIDPFRGDIDHVQVWDRIVTGREARDLVVQEAKATGRWKLDSASGNPLTTPDEVPGGNPAELGGGATVDPGGGSEVFLDLGTLNLDGLNGYAATTATPVRTDQSFTVSTWAQTAGVPTRDTTVLSMGGANESALSVRWKYTGTNGNVPVGRWEAEVRNQDGNGSTLTTVSHEPDASSAAYPWAHLTVTYDSLSRKLSLYVNGQLSLANCNGAPNCDPTPSENTAVRPFQANSGLQFGRSRSAGSYRDLFSGQLHDVWTFQGLLRQDQIIRLADYNSTIRTETGP